jgi:hypothetical protein
MAKDVEKKIKKTLKYLKARNFMPLYADSSEEACDMMLNLIPQNSVVGVGDSSSVRQIGIIKELERRGNRVINPFDPERPIGDPKDYAAFVFRSSIEAARCDLFLTGTNAVTEDGRLLNIDGVGNRVAGMIWGHPRVILAVGKNKIVKDLDEAFYRLRHVTAPEHASRRGVSSAPCSIKGECMDCIGTKRICNVTTIMEGSPLFTEITVIIVNEDLGLGWDLTWPRERIEQISERHNRFMWSMAEEAMGSLTREELWEKVSDFITPKPK